MTGPLARLSPNQRLAAAAFVLGAVALFAHPSPGGLVTLNAKEMALTVSKDADRIGSLELADWIVAGRSDFRVVDLRDAAAYAAYHVPGAENIPLSALPDSGLLRNERIVLYADGAVESAQAWLLLRAKGYRGAYLLDGGLTEWKSQVLFPRLAPDATPTDAAANLKRQALAAHFGGVAQSGDGTANATPTPAMPKIEAPAGGNAAMTPAGGKKKKEGC